MLCKAADGLHQDLLVSPEHGLHQTCHSTSEQSEVQFHWIPRPPWTLNDNLLRAGRWAINLIVLIFDCIWICPQVSSPHSDRSAVGLSGRLCWALPAIELSAQCIMQSLWANVPNTWSHYTHCELLARNWPWKLPLQVDAVPLEPQRSHNYPGTPCVSCLTVSLVPQYDFPVSWTFSRWCHKCDLPECHTDGGWLSALLTNNGKCLDDQKKYPKQEECKSSQMVSWVMLRTTPGSAPPPTQVSIDG